MKPEVLYRYRGLTENTLLNLEKGDVFFQAPDRFNDPFEVDLYCHFSGNVSDARQHFESFVKYEVSRVMGGALRGGLDHGIGYLSSLAKETSEQNDVGPTRAKLMNLSERDITGANQIISDFWEKRKRVACKTFGICCFAEEATNHLMWAHYGDQHKGLCIMVDPRKRPVIDWNRYLYEPVSYLPQRTINVIECGYERAMSHLLLSKGQPWSYEKEWRLVSNRGKGVQHSSNRNIVGVILGLRIAENDLKIRKRLYTVLTEFTVRQRTAFCTPRSRPASLNVYKIEKHPREYELIIKGVADLRQDLGIASG